MSTWSKDELRKIAEADDPHISPLRKDGVTYAHLDDNLPAADLELTASDMAAIDAAFAEIDIQGAPLSAALDAAIDR